MSEEKNYPSLSTLDRGTRSVYVYTHTSSLLRCGAISEWTDCGCRLNTNKHFACREQNSWTTGFQPTLARAQLISVPHCCCLAIRNLRCQPRRRPLWGKSSPPGPPLLSGGIKSYLRFGFFYLFRCLCGLLLTGIYHEASYAFDDCAAEGPARGAGVEG